MDDTFLEKIVRQRKTTQDYVKMAGYLLAALLLLFAAFLFQSILDILVVVVVGGVGYGLWYFLSGLNREFEYSVTNGELDIDVIYSRRKRKRVFSGAAKQFEMMAQISSDEYRQAQKGQYKLLDCSAYPGARENWFLVTEYQGGRVLVVFAPDERMLKHLKKYNPSKIRYSEYGR